MELDSNRYGSEYKLPERYIMLVIIFIGLVVLFVIFAFMSLNGRNRKVVAGTTARIIGTGIVATGRFAWETTTMVSRAGALAGQSLEDGAQDSIDAYQTIGTHIKANGGNTVYGNQLGVDAADFVGIVDANASLLDSLEAIKAERAERKASRKA